MELHIRFIILAMGRRSLVNTRPLQRFLVTMLTIEQRFIFTEFKAVILVACAVAIVLRYDLTSKGHVIEDIISAAF